MKMKEFVPGVPLDPPMVFVVKSFNGNVTGAGALALEEWVGLCPGESVSRGGLCPRDLCLGSEEGLCPEGISVPGFSVQGVSIRGAGGLSGRTPYGYRRAVHILLECILILSIRFCTHTMLPSAVIFKHIARYSCDAAIFS